MNVITLGFCDDLGEDEDEDEEDAEDKSKEVKQSAGETKAQFENKKLLVEIVDKVKGAIFPANIAIDIYKQFKKREVMARTKYRGSLDLAQHCKLNVQIYSRTREETFPTLKKHSKVAEETTAAN